MRVPPSHATAMPGKVPQLARVRKAWDSILLHVAARSSDLALRDIGLLRLTGHGPRHWLATWAAHFMFSLPAREEIGRWVGDIVLLVGEERDTRQRSARAICAVRYARDASRQSQIRLVKDLVEAIASVAPYDMHVLDRVIASEFYKMH